MIRDLYDNFNIRFKTVVDADKVGTTFNDLIAKVNNIYSRG